MSKATSLEELQALRLSVERLPWFWPVAVLSLLLGQVGLPSLSGKVVGLGLRFRLV